MGLLELFKCSKRTQPIENLNISTSDGYSIKLAVIVGHTKEQSGATLTVKTAEGDKTVSEYEYNSEIAELIKKEAIGKFIDVEIITRDVIGIVGAYAKAEKCDLAIELHFNSEATGQAYGTETLCSTRADDQHFAEIIQSHVNHLFNSKNRGVKAIPKTDRGGQSVWAMADAPNCLIEPFFGSNAADADLGMKAKNYYAKTIIAAIEFYAKDKKIILGKNS